MPAESRPIIALAGRLSRNEAASTLTATVRPRVLLTVHNQPLAKKSGNGISQAQSSPTVDDKLSWTIFPDQKADKHQPRPKMLPQMMFDPHSS